MSEVTRQGKAARAKLDQDIENQVPILMARIRDENLSMADLFAEADRIAYEASVCREALWKLITSRRVSITEDRLIIPTGESDVE